MFEDIKASIRKYVIELPTNQAQHLFAQSFIWYSLHAYWQTITSGMPEIFASLPPFLSRITLLSLDERQLPFARHIGKWAAEQHPIKASYEIGNLYTSLLPKDYRSRYGVYYTPPALSDRLLDLAEKAGADWAIHSVLDPACGGGAFLAPVAERMQKAHQGEKAESILTSIAEKLRGYELDPFAGWLSQVFTEAILMELCVETKTRLPVLVTIKDTLADKIKGDSPDIIIGNPPYGRIQLSEKDREYFSRSLYGHANLYGLFTHYAVENVAQNGIVAYVTPTSFLSGQYFKSLRKLLTKEARPISIDFISAREGVFDEVLQETLLITYRRGSQNSSVEASLLDVATEGSIDLKTLGRYSVPKRSEEPWILPREKRHVNIIKRIDKLSCRLADYGFSVSTGPLVWNRHKASLREEYSEKRFPIIWAEAISPSGGFSFRADKHNHLPYFEPENNEAWLVRYRPCVLIQRTTAKEQNRRLIAAVLPAEFIAKYGGVVIENHLNMILPNCDDPPVSLEVISALLNSQVIDHIFRCMNGSVAVSAYELESLPLPPIRELAHVIEMVQEHRDKVKIDQAIEEIYVEHSASFIDSRCSSNSREIRVDFPAGIIK